MKRILLVVDYKDLSDKLLSKSNYLVLPFLAEVKVVVFVSAVLEKKVDETNLMSLAKSAAESITNKFDPALNVSTLVVVDEDASRWVKRYNAENKVDLVLKVAARADQYFYTPNDWQLIRQLSIPVLIASTKKWKAKAKILVIVDINDAHEKQRKINISALRAAYHFTKLHNAELHLAYSIPITKALTELDIVEPSDVLAKNGDVSKKMLEKFVASCELEVDQIHVVAGDAADTIPRLSQQLKVDLLVMGSVGRTGLKSFLLGNTAERVLNKLRTDALIIKPE